MLVLCLGTAYACAEGEKDCLIKADWVAVMKYHIPLSFCTSDSPFVKCSDVSQVECKILASKAVDECLDDNDKSIPELLSKTESGNLGATIGDCTGSKLFNRIKFKEDKDVSCREYLHPIAPNAKLPQSKIEKAY